MSTRKDIRKIFSFSDLDPATLNAGKEEQDRIRRIKERNDMCPSNNSIDLDRSYNNLSIDRTVLSYGNSERALENYKPDNVQMPSLSGYPSNICSSNFHNKCFESDFIEIIIEDEDPITNDEVSVHNVLKPQTLTNRLECIMNDNQYPQTLISSYRQPDLDNSPVILTSPISKKRSNINPSSFNCEPFPNPSISFDLLNNSQISPVVQPQSFHTSPHFISNSVSLLPHLAKNAKPHQFEGLRFLFDNIIEDVNSFSRYKGGFGCILAHSMGLGKTFQSISFIELFLRYTVSTHVLIAAPVNTLHNWKREFDLWLPPFNVFSRCSEILNEEQFHRQFHLFTITENENTFKKRFTVLINWKQDGGVLIIGYELFRNLVGLHVDLNMKGKRKPKKFNPQSNEVFEILCNPGPDLVICDEGHRIKNDEAAISQAIKYIRTRRRIVLTGFPIQNNLLEYWCMVDFVRPSYLGSKKEFKNIFLRPIENGQCQNSMSEDVRLMLQRSHILHHMLLGIVQRKCEKILALDIPPKNEYVLFTTLSQYQARLYNVIVNDLREERKTNSSINPLLAFAICCKIWNHPEILYEICDRCTSASDLTRSLLEDEKDVLLEETSCKEYYNLVSDPSIIRNCFEGYQCALLDNGPKFLVLFDILDSAVSLGEKVLVFSQSISTLNLLEIFLSKSFVPSKTIQVNSVESNKISYSTEHWELCYNYLRLDGSCSSLERHHMITDFNDPSQDKIKLFLISTRAGSLGINLVSASRIIILDVSWNPCHDAQAVCRAFRFGQKRECFVYRLIADGTFESRMYKRQISKISTSERVLDNLKPQRVVSKEDLFTSITHPVQDVIPTPNLSCFSGEFKDPILKMICRKRQGILTQPPLLHQSFFGDSPDDQLNDIEKKEASTLFSSERELCRLREFNSRDSNRINESNLKTPTYSDHRNTRLKGDLVIGGSRNHSARIYDYKSMPSKTTIPFITHDRSIRETSPISITDSDEDIPVIDLDSSDISTIQSPIIIDLVEKNEIYDVTALQSDFQNDTVIIILDSPKN